jgi:hypothetical protein
MTAKATRVVLGLALIAATTPMALAQQTEVKSATVTLVRKPATTITVYIENLRDSPIDAYEIDLFAASDPTRRLGGETWVGQIPGVIKGIRPHETRAVELPVRGTSESAVARMTMVAFEDGYAEGSRPALDALRKKQQQRAEDLAWWVRVFDSMPRSSDAEVKEYLLAKTIERAPVEDLTFLRTNLRTILGSNGRQGWLLALIDKTYRPRAEAELASAKNFLSRSIAQDLPEAVKSVNIRSEPAASTDLVLRIENVRDVPIEAWRVDSEDRGGQSSQWTDACGSRSSDPHGSIQPHEVREESFSRRIANGEPLPVVKLGFVLFEDLSFEGSQAEVDRLFRGREQRADDLAFWIQALKEAAAMPIAEAKTFLEAKENDRARQAAAVRRPFGRGEIRDVLDQLERAPERFAAYVELKQKRMEEARTVLLRHLKAK